MFDGDYVIEVSKADISVNNILEAHHTLWKTEESFRVMKSMLEVRPIFHLTEKKIKASLEKIQESLNSMNPTEFGAEGHSFYLKTKWDEESNRVLKVLYINSPKGVIFFGELKI
jgi:hypothetical protein